MIRVGGSIRQVPKILKEFRHFRHSDKNFFFIRHLTFKSDVQFSTFRRFFSKKNF